MMSSLLFTLTVTQSSILSSAWEQQQPLCLCVCVRGRWGGGGGDLWGRLEQTWTRFASRVYFQTPVGGAKRAKSAQLLTVECIKLYLFIGCDSNSINTHHILRPNCSVLWSMHEQVMTQRAELRGWPLGLMLKDFKATFLKLTAH